MIPAVLIAIVIALVPIIAVVVGFILVDRRDRRRIRALVTERSGESICQFVRSLPYRELDTVIIREVYEAVQAAVSRFGSRVPVRATDHCIDTLEIDPEDFDHLVADLADRCGRSLVSLERNPFYGQAVTVGGLVRLLNAQPKLAVA